MRFFNIPGFFGLIAILSILKSNLIATILKCLLSENPIKNLKESQLIKNHPTNQRK